MSPARRMSRAEERISHSTARHADGSPVRLAVGAAITSEWVSQADARQAHDQRAMDRRSPDEFLAKWRQQTGA